MSGGELPPGWVEVALADLAGLQGVFVDGDWVESKDQDPAGDVRLVQLADVGDGFYRDRSSRFMTLGRAKELRCTFLNEGDVLISRMADPLGRACIFPGDERPCVTVVDVAIMRSVAVDHGWLVSGINSPQYRARIQAESSGTTRGRISRSRLGAIGIACPPLNEQRRIVAKLDELRARSRKAREALDEVPALLEKLKQSVLAAAFRGDLTAEWRAAQPPGSVEPASVLLDRIRAERRARWEQANPKKKYVEPAPVDTEGLPNLPAGWCWASMEQVAWDITVGFVGPMQHRYVERGVPFLRSQNVRENRFDPVGLLHVDEQFHNDLRKSALTAGDVITVRSGAPGTTCVVPPELHDSNCSDLVITRLTQSLVFPYFAAYFMNSHRARDQVLGAQVGVAQQHFNVGSMRRLHLPIPPRTEQAEVVRRVTQAFEQLLAVSGRVRGCLSEMDSLDQSILAMAFRGELVPQDPTDEPADALLARIKAHAAAPTTRKTRRSPT